MSTGWYDDVCTLSRRVTRNDIGPIQLVNRKEVYDELVS